MIEKRKDFEKDLSQIFQEDLPDYKKSVDIYKALCNTYWERNGSEISYSWRAAGECVASLRNELNLEVADPDICQNCGRSYDDHLQEKRSIVLPFSEEAIEFTDVYCNTDSSLRFCEGYSGSEDYMDFYCSGGEGKVEDWVEEKMSVAGYSYREA